MYDDSFPLQWVTAVIEEENRMYAVVSTNDTGFSEERYFPRLGLIVNEVANEIQKKIFHTF